VVESIEVREGQPVKKGQVLARLAEWQYRDELAGAQAKYQTAVAQMDRALAANDGTEAGIQRLQADFWRSEAARAQERLERTQVRSPVEGIVITPHVEQLVGRSLKPGDDFIDVADPSAALVDVKVDEDDVVLLRSGQAAAVKLDGFPARTFRGRVMVVSPKGELEGDQRYFAARVLVPNADGMIRSGMQGRSKIMTGWSASGRVVFRRAAMWIWAKLWYWFGW
jgi:RND family efflux transporter MFP subunit